jgi:hypothetical protein
MHHASHRGAPMSGAAVQGATIMATPVITYERGDSYVTEAGKGAHALVGTLYVGETPICDTFERMDGYIFMPPGVYVRSSMMIDKKRGKVVNPSLLSASGGNLEYAGKLKQTIAKLEADRAKAPSAKLDKELKDANLQLAKMGQYANILVHRGVNPSEYEGCVGAGWIEANKLTYADEAMEYIYSLVGGGLTSQPEVTFEVVGAMPSLAGLKPYAA